MDNEQPAQKAVAGALNTWLNDLSSSFLKLGGAVFLAAALAAFGWAWLQRGTVEMLPLQGSDGELASVNLSRALEDVSLGARSSIDIDPSVLLARETSPPQIAIPGLAFNFAQIVSFMQFGNMAPTRVHGAYKGADRAHELSLQVQGPLVGSASLQTESYPDPRDAFLDAAEQLWRVLDPIVLASYLHTRDPKESLAVVRDILQNPASPPRARAGAYRIWGIVLRDQMDYDGARARLRDSIDVMRGDESCADKSRARAWLDLGHTYLWEERWTTAQEVYREAMRLDSAWPAPHNFIGDALAGQGDLPGAIREYEVAIEIDPLYVEPWIGLGQVYARQERNLDAASAFTQARQRNINKGEVEDTRAAARTHYLLGEVLLKANCPAAAAHHFNRAVGFDASYEGKRSDITCQEKEEATGVAPDLVEAAASHADDADCIAMSTSTSPEPQLTAIASRRNR